MNISLPQGSFNKTSVDSQKTQGLSSSEDISGSFQELLQVLPIDERSHEKDLFSLIEEEDEKMANESSLVQMSLNELPALCEQKKEQPEQVDAALCIPSLPPLALISPSVDAAAVQNSFLPEIEAIFEKMASSMLVMSSSGEVEMSLILDNPRSIFFGTKITIREFSTAPKIFNVEITSFSPIIHTIESNKDNLLFAFQNGKFNFSIHRFETYIQNEERPVLHRKENSDGDNQERKGGREE